MPVTRANTALPRHAQLTRLGCEGDRTVQIAAMHCRAGRLPAHDDLRHGMTKPAEVADLRKDMTSADLRDELSGR